MVKRTKLSMDVSPWRGYPHGGRPGDDRRGGSRASVTGWPRVPVSGFGSVGLFGAGGAWFGTPVLGRRWRNGLTGLRWWLWFRRFAVLQLLAGRPAGPVLISVFGGCMPSVPDYYACRACLLMPAAMRCAVPTVKRPCGCIRTGMAAVRRPANGCGRSTRRGRCCGIRTAGLITTAVTGRPMACATGWTLLPEAVRRGFG